jgi:hypothetical protein
VDIPVCFSTTAVVEIDAQKSDIKQEVCPDTSERETEDVSETTDLSIWSESAVRSFLIKKDLSELLPLFGSINGRELLEVYTMCRVDSVAMYRSLKAELMKVHEKVLTISTYLHFIDRLRTVGDHGLPLDALMSNRHTEECLEEAD